MSININGKPNINQNNHLNSSNSEPSDDDCADVDEMIVISA
jgi:hypothetical protein